jgi:large conductance mechanosensitive channel
VFHGTSPAAQRQQQRFGSPRSADTGRNAGLMLQEFKTFIAKGNAIDLAVGVVIGAAFGKIVSSLVDDIIMPPLGLILGKVDFSQMFVSLDGKSYPTLAAAQEAAAPTLNYGNFITVGIQFFIIAWAIFLVVKAINTLKKKEEDKPATPPEPGAEEKLLVEIRDLLKKQAG